MLLFKTNIPETLTFQIIQASEFRMISKSLLFVIFRTTVRHHHRRRRHRQAVTTNHRENRRLVAEDIDTEWPSGTTEPRRTTSKSFRPTTRTEFM